MNAKRNALGKGLGALLGHTSQEDPAGLPVADSPSITGIVSSILIEKIEPNPFQPRNDFDAAALDELAESIRQHGIIQPITVRGLGNDRFQIISGERRWRASKMAGLDYIPAYTRLANDEGMLEMALVENIQRENLNPIEVALSFRRLVDEVGLSVEEVAARAAKDRSTVINYLRLLNLPALMQSAIREGRITMGHARAIINVDDAAMQLRIFNDIMANSLSVRKVEELVRVRKKKPVREPARDLPAEYRNIRDRLSAAFETKVDLQTRPGGSGKIVFSYYSTEDLNRLLDMLDA